MAKISRDMLREALKEVEIAEYKKICESPEFDIQVSDEFVARVDKLAAEIPYREETHKRLSAKKIVAILIAATLTVAAVLMSVSATREAIVRFFTTVHDSFVNLFVGEADPLPEQEGVYLPTELPDSYAQLMHEVGETSVLTLWSNGETEIFLEQGERLGGEIDLDNDNSEYDITMVGDYEVHHMEKGADICAAWLTENYSFMLNCPNNISWDDIVTIIESISLVTEQ